MKFDQIPTSLCLHFDLKSTANVGQSDVDIPNFHRISTSIFHEHIARNILDRISTKISMSKLGQNLVKIGGNIPTKFWRGIQIETWSIFTLDFWSICQRIDVEIWSIWFSGAHWTQFSLILMCSMFQFSAIKDAIFQVFCDFFSEGSQELFVAWRGHLSLRKFKNPTYFEGVRPSINIVHNRSYWVWSILPPDISR